MKNIALLNYKKIVFYLKYFSTIRSFFFPFLSLYLHSTNLINKILYLNIRIIFYIQVIILCFICIFYIHCTTFMCRSNISSFLSRDNFNFPTLMEYFWNKAIYADIYAYIFVYLKFFYLDVGSSMYLHKSLLSFSKRKSQNQYNHDLRYFYIFEFSRDNP